jgi:hypothetical protein
MSRTRECEGFLAPESLVTLAPPPLAREGSAARATAALASPVRAAEARARLEAWARRALGARRPAGRSPRTERR